MITVKDTGSGWQFSQTWDAGVKVKVNLKLRDERGDEDERDVEWTAPSDMQPHDALKEVAALINAEPFWDSSATGSFLSIELTNPANEKMVTIEIEQ